MGTENYTRLRGPGAEEIDEPSEKPLTRHVLPLDILAEEEAVYGHRDGPAFMMKRSEYDDQGKPQHVTVYLGEVTYGEAEAADDLQTTPG